MHFRYRHAAGITLAIAIGLLSGCAGDDHQAAARKPATAPSPSTTSPTQPTASPPTTTQSTGSTQPLPRSPQAYATAFEQAWAAADRASANRLGTAQAVADIFARSSDAETFSQCGGAAGSTYCTWTGASGTTLTIRVTNEAASQGQPHAVAEARWQSASTAPLPKTATAYADGLVRAWGLGDRQEAERYAQPSVLTALFGHADPGGSHWRRTTAGGAAGTTYVTYHDDAGGGTLTLAVTNATASLGKPHAVRQATFS